MYVLVASLFLLANGVPADTPLVVFTAKHHFATEDECMNYFDTDEGATSKARLEELLKHGPVGTYSLQYMCKKTEKEGSI